MFEYTTFENLVLSAPKEVQRKLEQLKFLRERPDYHPEPSCYEHIKIVTSRLAQTGNVNLILAGLFHDICKFDTVRMNEKNGFPTSPGHDLAASDFVLEYNNAKFIVQCGGDFQRVADICKQHMRVKQIDSMRKHKQDELKSMYIWEDLQIFSRADNMLNEFTL